MRSPTVLRLPYFYLSIDDRSFAPRGAHAANDKVACALKLRKRRPLGKNLSIAITCCRRSRWQSHRRAISLQVPWSPFAAQ